MYEINKQKIEEIEGDERKLKIFLMFFINIFLAKETLSLLTSDEKKFHFIPVNSLTARCLKLDKLLKTHSCPVDVVFVCSCRRCSSLCCFISLPKESRFILHKT